MALRNCRAKAGARLLTIASKQDCDECKERASQVPQSVIASAMDAEMLKNLGDHDPINLVKGGTDEFRGILEEWGIDPVQASALCQRLETYAAHTLFESRQPELPPGFTSLVEEAKEVSYSAL